jgi:hypothetical protein
MRGPSVSSSPTALTTTKTFPPTATGAETAEPRSADQSLVNGGAAVALATKLS